MSELPSQIPVWDKKHGAGDHEMLRNTPSPLAELSEIYFPRGSKILELGTGVGRDALYFASKGHAVLATDGSPKVIESDKHHFANPAVKFEVLDMLQPLPFPDGSFDVVYANLSLHYYSDPDTRKIIKEAAKVLNEGGVLAFASKSYDDLHNSGQEIQPNIFVSETGVVIHLFSEDYAKSLTQEDFEALYLDEVEEEYNGRRSKIVRYIGQKTNA